MRKLNWQAVSGRKLTWGASGLAVAALLVSTPAFADADAQASSPAAVQPAKNDGGRIEEIIVTASKRSENLQKTSRSLDVVGGVELTKTGVTNASQLEVPALQVANNGPYLQVTIHGVGDRSITSETDPGVAINVNGVYEPRAFESATSFFDLDRVEVLKGPQGTLYGRNATSGALNLVTAKPQPGTSGFVEAEVGNYGEKRLTAAINTQFSDTLFFRASGEFIDRHGYLSDGYDDDQRQAARLQLLWKPDPDDSLLLFAEYGHVGGRGDQPVILAPKGGPYVGNNPWAGPTNPAVVAYVGQDFAPNGYVNVDTYLLSATYEHRFDWATLTLLPSLIRSREVGLDYAGGIGTFEATTSTQPAIEARLSSPSASNGPVKWVVGAFASKETMHDLLLSQIASTFDLDSPTSARNDKSAAIFGEVTVRLLEKLRLTGGIRGTWESKIQNGYTVPVFFGTAQPPFDQENPPAAVPQPGSTACAACASTSGRLSESAVNYRAGLEYDVLRESMFYANFATGFRAGGFFVDSAPNSYKPETLDAYTVGLKNRLLDDHVQLNVEGFYWKYHNKQETYLAVANDATEGFVLQTKNAAQATVKGIDVSALVRPTSNDRLSVDVEYLKSNYNSFVFTTVGLGGPPATGCATTAVGGGLYSLDCSGKQLVRSPTWSGNVAYTHNQPLPGGSQLSFSARMHFSASYWLQDDFTPGERASGYTKTDLSLIWTDPSGKLSLTGYVDNVGDAVIYTNANQAAALNNLLLASIAPPRTYGFRLRVQF